MQETLAYVRVSDKRETARGMGELVQCEQIKRYCQANGLKWHFVTPDLGVSGGKPLEKRKGGKELLEKLEAGFTRIIVFKLDRLGRSVADIAGWIEDFQRRKITLISVSENFDLDTLSGWILAQHLVMFAEIERRMGSERMKALHSFLRDSGRIQGGQAPYGWYANLQGVLLEQPAEQRNIDLMKNLAGRGAKNSEIANVLNQREISTRKGTKWTETTVCRILQRARQKKKPATPPAAPAPEPPAPVEDFVSPIYSDPPTDAGN